MNAGVRRSRTLLSEWGLSLAAHHDAVWRLVLCGSLLLIVLVQVAANVGLLVSADHFAHELSVSNQVPWLTPIALALDHVGQREPIGGLLLGVATTLSRFRRTWRPVLLSVAALLAVNFIVGSLKLGYGRVKPFFGDTSPLAGGMIFPSGHTANVVLTWGLLAYLLIAYGRARIGRSSVKTVVGLSLLMGVITWFLDTHWFTDIVAGWLIGAILLQALILIDTVWPAAMDEDNDFLLPPDPFPSTASHPHRVGYGSPSSLPPAERRRDDEFQPAGSRSPVLTGSSRTAGPS